MANDKIASRDITSPEAYFSRRSLMRGAILASGAAATAWAYRRYNGVELVDTKTAPLSGLVKTASAGVAGEALTSYASVTNYNNFYEFTTNKNGVAAAARNFQTDGWTLAVDGLVHKPQTFDLDRLRRIAAPEERIYRMRCVEAWSMVVPWAGFSLSKLLNVVEPMGDAKYIAFETLHDAQRMPGQSSGVLDWPYVEGLRMDEAMHPLTLLATGLYGHQLPAQNGAPVRLIVPWKYGFKGVKSIVKITVTAMQPPTTWNRSAPSEYGFFANVNPGHPHPRWSQATEQRIGESGRRKTLLFNGYAEQVAGLYAGMDLDVHY
jgi:methionine sulfoxide reductase catalytic subunit